MIIAIEGVIGSGKSTTAQLVGARLASPVLLEETPDPDSLARFYSDPKRFAVETELGFLLLRARQLRGLSQENPVIADFSPAKNLVFGRVNLSGHDLAQFEQQYRSLMRRIARPRFGVFLDLPVDALMDRITRRGRPYEQEITADYLDRLRTSYLSNLDELAERVEIVSLAPADTQEAVLNRALDAVKPAAAPRDS